MTQLPNELMSGYFDELLTEEELGDLQSWLKSSPDHVREFVQWSLIHDRLRSERFSTTPDTLPTTKAHTESVSLNRKHTRRFAISVGAIATITMLLLIWMEFGKGTVSAATELRRIISAHEMGLGKVYQVAVEEVAEPRRLRDSADERTENRPPKPSLDGARLFVGHGGHFVLVRYLADQQQFITGSDGLTSWAIRPDGPVRVSADLNRFNRDLPGHEHAVPLTNMEQGLERLRTAYDVELLPVENNDETADDDAATRLLVALKKRGFRGPKRVEITYAVSNGQIRQLRFVDMPYGPERLTVRLTLADERPLDPEFFDHSSHHTPDRIIEQE